MGMETPTFNLKAVVRETRLKPETLRAWERRYGIPRPTRSAGGHRIYSRRDIDTVLWLIHQQQEGLSISRAAERWHTIEDAGQDPLREPGIARGRFLGGERWAGEPHFDSREEQGEDPQVSAARNDWLAACMAYDGNGAERTLAQAFARFAVETVCLDLLCQGLRQLGEAWHTDKVTVQQVHFATALAMQRIEILVGASPQQTRPGQILMACPPEEHHVFGLALLQLLLRRRGYGIVYLGDNVPLREMENTLQKIRPNLAILASQQLSSADNLLEMSERIAQQDVPVAFGGRIFNLLEPIRSAISGHFLGTDLKQAVAGVENLLKTPPPLNRPAQRPATYEDSLSSFHANLPRISAHVWSNMPTESAGLPSLEQYDFGLAKRIIATLKFGDLSLLSIDADWLCAFLNRRRIPLRLLEHYLSCYQSAVQTIQGSSGDPIVEMLAMFLEKFRSAAQQRPNDEDDRAIAT